MSQQNAPASSAGGVPGGRRGRPPGVVMALIGALVLALGVAITQGLVPRGAPAPTDWTDAPAASYANGATLSWSLDVRELLGDPTARFSFGTNLDDAADDLRYGPVDAGSAWVFTASGEGGFFALGVDPATGALLWKRERRLTSCVPTDSVGRLACVTADGPDGGRGAGSFILLDANTGNETRVAQWAAGAGMVVRAGTALIVLSGNSTPGDGWAVTAYDLAGNQRWVSGIDFGEPADIVAPLNASSDLVAVLTMERSRVLDAQTGRLLAEGEGGKLQVGEARTVYVPTAGDLKASDASVKILRGYQATGVGPSGAVGVFRQRDEALELCEPADPDRCTTLVVPLSSVSEDPAWEVAGRGYAPLTDGLTTRIVGFDDGAVTYEAADSWMSRTLLAPGDVVAESDWESHGDVRLVDPATGSRVASAALPGWVPVYRMPRRLMLMREPDINGFAAEVAVYAPATERTGSILSLIHI